MSEPQNPNDIVLKNKYYPTGLTEKQIYNYYIKNKNKILKETAGREIMFFLSPDVNKIIVKRKVKDRFIKLTPRNYETTITGRSLSIHSTMHRMEDFGIIDIDCNDFTKAKLATFETYKWARKTLPISDVKIRYTGKESFHIFIYFSVKKKIDSIRLLLRRTLLQSPLLEKFTLRTGRISGVPNLDISSNKYRGGYITLHSLSTLGLKCQEVTDRNILSFIKESARI